MDLPVDLNRAGVLCRQVLASTASVGREPSAFPVIGGFGSFASPASILKW
jgi:hypothetical protein